MVTMFPVPRENKHRGSLIVDGKGNTLTILTILTAEGASESRANGRTSRCPEEACAGAASGAAENVVHGDLLGAADATLGALATASPSVRTRRVQTAVGARLSATLIPASDPTRGAGHAATAESCRSQETRSPVAENHPLDAARVGLADSRRRGVAAGHEPGRPAPRGERIQLHDLPATMAGKRGKAPLEQPAASLVGAGSVVGPHEDGPAMAGAGAGSSEARGGAVVPLRGSNTAAPDEPRRRSTLPSPRRLPRGRRWRCGVGHAPASPPAKRTSCRTGGRRGPASLRPPGGPSEASRRHPVVRRARRHHGAARAQQRGVQVTPRRPTP